MRLRVSDLQTFYGETQVLFNVSLEVGAGEVVSLLGPNGAGKTTTLRSILGLTPPKSGRISFQGREITREPTHREPEAEEVRARPDHHHPQPRQPVVPRATLSARTP